METLTAVRVRAWRLRAQGLAGQPRPATAAQAVRRAGALQAQDTKACRLQLRARSHATVAADLDTACAAGERSVVRTWLMRGTLHAVPAVDVRWTTALLGPRFAAASRGRREQLGLDEAACARGLRALEEALAGQPPMLREDVVRALSRLGVELDPRGQTPAHLLAYAAHLGLVCRGPEGPADKATYVSRDAWLDGVPDAGLTGEEALAELALRHLAAYAPVTAADFARWSGLPQGPARTAHRLIGDRTVEIATPAGPMRIPADAEPPAEAPDGEPPPVRLIGHFDPYLLGYADRGLLLDPRFARRVATGGGFLTPVVLIGGEVRATWRHEWRGAGRLAVRVEPFEELPRDAWPGIDAEIADIGRFLGAEASRLTPNGQPP
jgi:hypothetical protein